MVTLDDRVSRLEGKMDSLATKEDLATLRADMTQQLANHRADMMDQITSLRAEVIEQLGQQRAETKEMEARIIKWTMGAVLAGMALATSVGIAF